MCTIYNMKVIKDSMVLINLAKINLLEKSCDYFKNVFIPIEVFNESVVKGKEKNLEEDYIIENLIKNKKIEIKNVKDKKLIKMSNEFNIYRGEAECLELYKQEKADLIISDDNNLRKKKKILETKIIGSLAVVLKLKRVNMIDHVKFRNSIEKMREIGWFSNALLDKVLMEGTKNG